MQQTRRQKKLQHSTRTVENFELTAKGLQERKSTIEWDDGGKIGNKDQLIPYTLLQGVRLLVPTNH